MSSQNKSIFSKRRKYLVRCIIPYLFTSYIRPVLSLDPNIYNIKIVNLNLKRTSITFFYCQINLTYFWRILHAPVVNIFDESEQHSCFILLDLGCNSHFKLPYAFSLRKGKILSCSKFLPLFTSKIVNLIKKI